MRKARAIGLCLLAGTLGGCTPSLVEPRMGARLEPFGSVAAYQRHLTHLASTATRVRSPPALWRTGIPSPGAVSGGSVRHEADVECMRLVNGHLVVLDEGWVRSFRPTGPSFVLVSEAKAFEAEPSDGLLQLLSVGDAVVAVGHDTAARALALARFTVRHDGQVERRAVRYLRLDMGGGRGYASRLVGRSLRLYAPTAPLFPWQDQSIELELPTTAITRALAPLQDGAWVPLLSGAEVVRPLDESSASLHQLVSCDLGRDDLPCRARAAFADAQVAFQLEDDAVLLWTCSQTSSEEATLLRLPFDEGDPSAAYVTGRAVGAAPIAVANARVSVLTIGTCGGGPIGDSAHAAWKEPRLLELPVEALSVAPPAVLPTAYQAIPPPSVPGPLEGAFIDDTWVYGSHTDSLRESSSPSSLVAVQIHGGREPVELRLDHPVSRLLSLGQTVAAVGLVDGGSALSVVRLSPVAQVIGHDRVATDEPIGSAWARRAAVSYASTSAETGLLFVHEPPELGPQALNVVAVRSGRSRLATRLVATDTAEAATAASSSYCGERHRLARPLVRGERLFALVDCDLVEASVSGGTVREQRRLTLPPPGSNGPSARREPMLEGRGP